jgi:hypothetical protein
VKPKSILLLPYPFANLKPPDQLLMDEVNGDMDYGRQTVIRGRLNQPFVHSIAFPQSHSHCQRP